MQLRSLIYAVSSSGTIYNDLYFNYIDCLMSSGNHESLFLAVKETAKTDLYDTNLSEFDTSYNEKVCMYVITYEKPYLVFNFLSSTTPGISSNPKALQCL